MTDADTLDIIAMTLAGGDKSRDEQRALGRTVMRTATSVRKMQRTLDEIVADAREDELRRLPVQTGNAELNACVHIVAAALAAIHAVPPDSRDPVASTVITALLGELLPQASDPRRMLMQLMATAEPDMVRHGLATRDTSPTPVAFPTTGRVH